MASHSASGWLRLHSGGWSFERGWQVSDAPDEEVTSSEDDGESDVAGEDEKED